MAESKISGKTPGETEITGSTNHPKAAGIMAKMFGDFFSLFAWIEEASPEELKVIKARSNLSSAEAKAAKK